MYFFLRTISDNEIDFICQTNEGGLNAYEAKYSQFKIPQYQRDSMLLDKIHLNNTFVVNQNLTQKKEELISSLFRSFVESTGVKL